MNKKNLKASLLGVFFSALLIAPAALADNFEIIIVSDDVSDSTGSLPTWTNDGSAGWKTVQGRGTGTAIDTSYTAPAPSPSPSPGGGPGGGPPSPSPGGGPGTP
jgi:hypothetical protein